MHLIAHDHQCLLQVFISDQIHCTPNLKATFAIDFFLYCLIECYNCYQNLKDHSSPLKDSFLCLLLFSMQHNFNVFFYHSCWYKILLILLSLCDHSTLYEYRLVGLYSKSDKAFHLSFKASLINVSYCGGSSNVAMSIETH